MFACLAGDTADNSEHSIALKYVWDFSKKVKAKEMTFFEGFDKARSTETKPLSPDDIKNLILKLLKQ